MAAANLKAHRHRRDVARRAIRTDDAGLVTKMVRDGLDVNASPSSIGYSLIHLAAAEDAKETLIALIALGAHINATDHDARTALHVAVSWGSLKCARLLIDYGAELDTPNASGRTALHRAAYMGSTPAVLMLLESGADPSLSDEEGRRPVDLAVTRGLHAVAALLSKRKIE